MKDKQENIVFWKT